MTQREFNKHCEVITPLVDVIYFVEDEGILFDEGDGPIAEILICGELRSFAPIESVEDFLEMLEQFLYFQRNY